LFQTDAGKHEFERLWLFQVSGKDARARSEHLREELTGQAARSFSKKGDYGRVTEEAGPAVIAFAPAAFGESLARGAR
jgi:hypothetical protein